MRYNTLRQLVVAALLVGGSVASTAVLANGPARIWTEKRFVKPLDPDGPVSMSAFSRLAKEMSPAVVNINTTRVNTGAAASSGQGTGFIIHRSGYVLTNNHVIDGARGIDVKLMNGKSFPAQVVGTYSELDIALLKFVPTEPLSVAPLGKSTTLEIGEWVVAIGNPFGLNHTVTAGIVSGKGRRDILNGPKQARFIQTDASINPGNSGGPLINIRGEVVAINTAISSNGQGIGFAVPIDMVKIILPQLQRGKVNRSFLGVTVGPVSAALASGNGLPRDTGAHVRDVMGAPAIAADIAVDDVILTWNGEPLARWDDVPWLASTGGEGATVQLTLSRSGKVLERTVVLGRFPDKTAEAEPAVEEVTWEVQQYQGIGLEVAGASPGGPTVTTEPGVLITSVERGKIAHAAGLQLGDVITQLNYQTVDTIRRFGKIMVEIGPGAQVVFTVRRRGSTLFKSIVRPTAGAPPGSHTQSPELAPRVRTPRPGGLAPSPSVLPTLR